MDRLTPEVEKELVDREFKYMHDHRRMFFWAFIGCLVTWGTAFLLIIAGAMGLWVALHR